jgi:hypothetical protein
MRIHKKTIATAFILLVSGDLFAAEPTDPQKTNDGGSQVDDGSIAWGFNQKTKADSNQTDDNPTRQLADENNQLPKWKVILNQTPGQKPLPIYTESDKAMIPFGARPDFNKILQLQNEFKVQVLKNSRVNASPETYELLQEKFLQDNYIHGEQYVLPDDLVVSKLQSHSFSGIIKKREDQMMTLPSYEDERYNNAYKDQLEGVDFKNGPAGCKPGVNEGDPVNCFAGLDEKAVNVYPETLPIMTYLAALSNVTSIVNHSREHMCDISVYKKGWWVTASHCINDNVTASGVIQKDENGVIIGNRVVPLSGKKFVGCGTACDIVLIEMDTPDDSVYPLLISAATQVSASESIFVPGMPVGEPLADILKGSTVFERPDPEEVRARYNKHVGWSPYGAGYCKVLKQYPNGCIIHGCNSVIGFSGAPMYSYDVKLDKVKLVGIHSGTKNTFNGCELQKDNKNQELATNYARLISTNGAKK